MAEAHARPGGSDLTILDLLRERPEVQLAAAYVGAAWLFYDVADLVVFAFGLPEALLRGLLAVLAIGTALVLLLGHWLRLTVLALRRGRRDPNEDIRGVPDLLEPLLLRAAGTVRPRTAQLAVALAAVAFLALFVFLGNAWAAAHDQEAPDSRVTVVVFPFEESGAGGERLGPGVADLLSVTLDGTPGVRVVHPEGAWRSLTATEDGAPLPPTLERARAISREIGATRFVTGNIVGSGSRLEIGARVRETASGGDGAQVRLSAHVDSLGGALDAIAIEVVRAVWSRDRLPTVPEIDRSVTASAEALKAYLEAQSAFRRGYLSDAREAIDRAVAADSTFALAHLARFRIEANEQASLGQPPTGLRPILDHALRHAERLTPRNRMRIDAHTAMDVSDGPTAAFLFDRILAIDSLDVDALQGIAFATHTYGWQMGRGPADIIEAYHDIVRADSGNVGALSALLRLATLRPDLVAAEPWLRLLTEQDSLAGTPLGTVGAYEILDAEPSRIDSLLSRWAREGPATVASTLRGLRVVDPDRAERFLLVLGGSSMPAYHRSVSASGLAQLWIARGRLQAADSLVRAGALPGLEVTLAAFQTAAAVAGLHDPALARLSVEQLRAYLPFDSLQAYADERAPWVNGWLVGAYHATLGDTVTARAWARALGELEAGDDTTVPEWPAALEADVTARIAARRGDPTAAEEWARRAYEAWIIHAMGAFEAEPEPAMRLHLAERLRERGATAQARELYRSLAPPFTWMGFQTTRASLRLASILENEGALAEAAFHYRTAARLLSTGDEHVVGALRREAREGLARTEG